MRRLSILVPLVLVLLASIAVLPARAAPTSVRPAQMPLTKTFTGSRDVPETVSSTVLTYSALVGVRKILLVDGRVLITVGRNVKGCTVPDVSIYDPTTRMLSPLTPTSAGGGYRSGTILFDGRVLIGRSRPTCSAEPLPYEVFDPQTNTFSVVADIGTLPPAATLLHDRRLVTIRDGRIQTFEPATATTGMSGTLTFSHTNYVLTALADQRVLVSDLSATTPSEVYDPATGSVTTVGAMNRSREGAVTVLLNSGRVLIAGVEGTAEEFVPTTGQFVKRSNLGELSNTAAATLLADGRAMLIGRRHVVVYDPITLQTRTLRGSPFRVDSGISLFDGSLLVFSSSTTGYQSIAAVRYAPANHFDGSLTLPTGWINQRTFKVTVVASSTVAPIEAVRVDLADWQPATAGQPISVTTLTDEDTPFLGYGLYVRDQNGLESHIVSGNVKIDTTPPESQFAALPAISPNTFQLNWSYSDATSGVKTVAVEVREGLDGAWRRVVDSTKATSTTFSGADGVQYFFRVRGTDEAGNVEAWPDTYDTQTTVDFIEEHLVYLPFVRR